MYFLFHFHKKIKKKYISYWMFQHKNIFKHHFYTFNGFISAFCENKKLHSHYTAYRNINMMNNNNNLCNVLYLNVSVTQLTSALITVNSRIISANNTLQYSLYCEN